MEIILNCKQFLFRKSLFFFILIFAQNKTWKLSISFNQLIHNVVNFARDWIKVNTMFLFHMAVFFTLKTVNSPIGGMHRKMSTMEMTMAKKTCGYCCRCLAHALCLCTLLERSRQMLYKWLSIHREIENICKNVLCDREFPLIYGIIHGKFQLSSAN